MADVEADLEDWSTTPGSNKPAGTTAIGTGLDDNLQQIQATTRKYLSNKGADIASASALPLDTATGNFVDVTGTTAITSIATMSAGRSFLLQFDGALTLTHGAALLLPGGANITTAAGDTCLVVSVGSGNWIVPWYSPDVQSPILLDEDDMSSDSAVHAPSQQSVSAYVTAEVDAVTIASGAMSGASLDLTGLSSTTYAAYKLFYWGLDPASDGDNLYLRVSDDNGSTFKSGAAEYQWAISGHTSADTAANTGDASDAQIQIAGGHGTAAGEKSAGEITILQHDETGEGARFVWNVARMTTATGLTHTTGSGISTTSAIDAIQLYFSSGNISSGEYALIGYKL